MLFTCYLFLCVIYVINVYLLLGLTCVMGGADVFCPWYLSPRCAQGAIKAVVEQVNEGYAFKIPNKREQN